MDQLHEKYENLKVYLKSLANRRFAAGHIAD